MIRTASGVCMQCCKKHGTGKTICKPCSLRSVDAYRERRKQNKLLVIEYFGGKCLDCGISDIRVLTLHHVKGNGALDCAKKEWKTNGWI